MVKGGCKIEKGEKTISELTVGTWTSKFREKLDKMVTDGQIKDYTDTSTDTDVHIKVKLGESAEPVEKLLVDKVKMTNMHAFNSKCVVHKYESPNEILREFVTVRLDLYVKRRDHMLKVLRDKLPYHFNVVKFINMQCLNTPTPDLRRKTDVECTQLLEKHGFEKIKGNYDYLLNLPIASITLTHAKKHEQDLEKLKQQIEELEDMTASEMWLNDLERLKI